jgi:flagellum-specific peptidoglycan hydrolase FlgJ
MLQRKQLDALNAFSRAAVRSERLYGVPAELSVAQAVLESGWGARMPGNNCFGIKASPNNPRRVTVATHEVFTQEQYDAWRRNHPGRASVIEERLADGRLNVRLDDDFATFDNLAGCFEAHAILLSQQAPYSTMLAKFQATENYPVYVEHVAATYATSPSYGKQLLAVASMHPVQDALEAARKGAANGCPQ